MRAHKTAGNVFYYDRGYPDESDASNHLLRNVDGGVVLCKKKFDAPTLDQDDPEFYFIFSKADHGERLTNELDLLHLSPKQGAKLADLIKQYLCIFDDHGTFVPVRIYQCVLDTGSAAVIAIKKIHYG
jgi:hypothetical protein